MIKNISHIDIKIIQISNDQKNSSNNAFKFNLNLVQMIKKYSSIERKNLNEPKNSSNEQKNSSNEQKIVQMIKKIVQMSKKKIN